MANTRAEITNAGYKIIPWGDWETAMAHLREGKHICIEVPDNIYPEDITQALPIPVGMDVDGALIRTTGTLNGNPSGFTHTADLFDRMRELQDKRRRSQHHV